MAMREFYAASAYSHFALALPMNLFLLWLIATETPKEMQPYSRILAQTTVCEIVGILLHTSLQPVALVEDDGNYTGVLLGPLGENLGFPWDLILYEAWSFFMLIHLHQFPAQFFYRWVMVVHNRKMPFVMYLALAMAPSLFATIIQYIEFWNPPEEVLHRPLTPWIQKALEVQTQNYIRTGYDPNDFLIKFGQWSNFGINLLSAVIIVFFGWKTSKFVRQNLHGPNAERDRILNAQVNRVMMGQALVAILVILIPNSVIQLVFIHPFFSMTPEQGLWLTLTLLTECDWVPIFNAVVVILSVRAYRLRTRRLIAKLFQCCFKCGNNSSVTTLVEVLSPPAINPIGK